MRITIACQWCRKSKIKCHHNGQAPCRACSTIPHRQCILSEPQTRSSQTKKKKAQNSHSATTPNELSRTDAAHNSIRRSFQQSRASNEGELGSDLPLLANKQARRHGIDENLVHNACHVFLDMFPEFAFIHRPSFLIDLQTNCVDEMKTFAILALCARYIPELQHQFGGPVEASEHFARKAQDLLAKRVTARADVDTLQCVLMLTLQDWGTCRGFRAWMSIGIASRMCQAFSSLMHPRHQYGSRERLAHLESLTPTQYEVICRTIWSSFILDCMLGSGKHGPPAYGEVAPSIRLPIEEDSFCFETVSSTPPIHFSRVLKPDQPGHISQEEHLSLEDYQTIVIRGIDIWSTLAQWICKGGRRIVTPDPFEAPWMPEAVWHRLYTALKRWHNTVDPRLWFSSSTRNMDVYISRGQGRQFAMINLLLSLNRIFLHREYIPFLPHQVRQPQGPIDPPLLPRNAPDNWWIDGANELFEAAATIVDVLQRLQDRGVEFQTPFVCFCLYSGAATLAYAQAFPHMTSGLQNISSRLDWSLRWLKKAEHLWPICQGWSKIVEDFIVLYTKVKQHAQSLPAIGRDDFVELDEALQRFAEVEASPSQTSIGSTANILFSMSQSRKPVSQSKSVPLEVEAIERMMSTPAVSEGLVQPGALETNPPVQFHQRSGEKIYSVLDDSSNLFNEIDSYDFEDFGRSQGLIASMLGNPSMKDWFYLDQSY